VSRIQALVPIECSGITISYVWLPAPVTFPVSSLTVSNQEFQPSYKSYYSTKLNKNVEYGYITVSPSLVHGDGSVASLPGSIGTSAEEPQLPWQALTSGIVNSPERGEKSILTKFLSGQDFLPATLAVEQELAVTNQSDRVLRVPGDPLWNSIPPTFLDVNWVEQMWPIVSATFSGTPTSVTVTGPFPAVFPYVDQSMPVETTPLVCFLLNGSGATLSGVPNVVRIVKTSSDAIKRYPAAVHFTINVSSSVDDINFDVELYVG